MVNAVVMMWLEREASALVKERERSEAQEKLDALRRAARERARANYRPKAVREREAIARMLAEIEGQTALRLAEKNDGN
jgi:hypothetical protein